MAGQHDGHLGAVYDATTPDEIARHYDAWAPTYDEDMGRNGYRHPTIASALLTRHLPRGASPVLDAGAGTGLLGSWLGILGYPRLEALDVSEGMLAQARARGGYQAFHNAALGTPLPFADGHFSGVISTGVFTTGHVGQEGMPELLRITRPGGVIVITVKDTLWHNGFAAYIAGLEGKNRLTRLEETEPYVSMPGEVGTVPGRALALRVV